MDSLKETIVLYENLITKMQEITDTTESEEIKGCLKGTIWHYEIKITKLMDLIEEL